jgi:restriction system protein
LLQFLNLKEDQINEIHQANTTKLSYRLGAGNYLKRYGVLENSSRGVWSLMEQGLKTKIC